MTLRFGEIVIDEKKIIEMPDGMLGFPDRRFIILSPDNNGQFFWLQSLDDPELAFVVTDPSLYTEGYEVKLTSDEYVKLGLEADSEVLLLAVVTMAGDVKEITLNLQGPIVVNPERMVAKQIVLGEGKYGTKYPLFAGLSDSVATSSAPFLDRLSAICINS
jgi:flagellar assembly factor FliW